ncbi:tetratricopeptide repeat family protein [Lyngbya aestuarii BL J]|uniref:Tetratricopeptide repeat family protein n=2 Tax=Lyngbya aestuarii BL J TaxID=1348334 RepID=U7QFW3_9CYAN|nr:tetratricopeptide repeat family protein [Lyngbya aestuarii]ERT06798.1 tetratricopeptide repeat family protein [Lyngbya aestuarii BL J]
MNKNREQSLNRHELLKQSLRQNPPDPNRIFDLFLNKSELEINLENVITVLRDSYDKNQYFEKRSQLLVKFLDKALRILSTTEQWLDEIDRLINEYEKSSINLPASLYYAKFRCLATLSVSDAKAESFIEKAIDLEINIYNQLDYQLELAMYYENTSQYRKMKKIIDQCEILCRQYSNLDQQLARTLLYLGHYYFYTFQLDKAANYMNQAQNILETIYQEERDQEEKEILKLLSTCLHYLGRVYFAQYNFVRASRFYIKAQQVLEKARTKYTLSNDLGATAFYHLRLGQVLEASKLIESADYHYDKSQKEFEKCGNLSGKMQVSLARANLIGSQVDDCMVNKKSIWKKQVLQLRDAAQDAQDIGYDRGYLEALLRRFLLDIKYAQIGDLIKVSFAIVTASEFYKFIFSNPSLLISKLQLAIGLYGMGPYHMIRLNQKQKRQPHFILKACPCRYPECRKRINTLI